MNIDAASAVDDQVSNQIRNPAVNSVYYIDHDWGISNQVNIKVSHQVWNQVTDPVRNQVNRTKNAITAPDLRRTPFGEVFMAFSITKETII